MSARNIIVIVLVLLAVILMVQNTEVVNVRLFFWQVSMSRIILIFLMLLIGFVLGLVVGRSRKR